MAEQNAAAGEQIRYLRCDRIDPERLTIDDWWLLDDTLVAFTAFHPGGLLAGGIISTEPNIVGYCREVRDYMVGRNAIRKLRGNQGPMTA